MEVVLGPDGLNPLFSNHLMFDMLQWG
ncbi:hypothetical protein HaLaN_20809, partial [Haematococcus lacustris]